MSDHRQTPYAHVLSSGLAETCSNFVVVAAIGSNYAHAMRRVALFISVAVLKLRAVPSRVLNVSEAKPGAALEILKAKRSERPQYVARSPDSESDDWGLTALQVICEERLIVVLASAYDPQPAFSAPSFHFLHKTMEADINANTKAQ